MASKIREPFQQVLRVYLGQSDYDKIAAKVRQTTCRSLSEYGRKLLLGGPVTMTYRNKSADEAVEVSIELIGTLKKLLTYASITPADKEWLQKEIHSIASSTEKLFSLCLPK